MAFGLLCKKCGHQEAEHDYPDDYPNVCRAYKSPDGKGEAAMWRAEREEEAKESSVRDRWANT